MPVQLPMLSQRRAALETCGYCPKLCRAKCPVSDAIPTDSLTPWGKMSMAWLAERGDVPADLAHANVVWGCSGCFACKTACEHENPVAQTLLDARRDVRGQDRAPEGIERVLRGQARRAKLIGQRVRQLSRELSLSNQSRTALLVGCGYWLHEPALVRSLVRSLKLLAGDLKIVGECCGAVMRYAGDGLGLDVQRHRLDKALAGTDLVLAYDPGCAMELQRFDQMLTVVEWVAQRVERLTPAPRRLGELGPLRYHDPCQLGRGLGQYDAPRRVLARLTASDAHEFRYRRSDARCSGGGALLPAAYPEAASLIARRRTDEHLALGGGTIVTACASSLRRFRASGAQVVDWADLLSYGLGGHERAGRDLVER